MNHRLSIALLVLVPLATVSVAVVFWRSYQERNAEHYRTFENPFGDARIVVYSLKPLFPIAFGSASDGEAFVTLESPQGTVLEKTRTEFLAQNVEEVDWSATEVWVPLVATWEIPPRLRQKTNHNLQPSGR